MLGGSNKPVQSEAPVHSAWSGRMTALHWLQSFSPAGPAPSAGSIPSPVELSMCHTQDESADVRRVCCWNLVLRVAYLRHSYDCLKQCKQESSHEEGVPTLRHTNESSAVMGKTLYTGPHLVCLNCNMCGCSVSQSCTQAQPGHVSKQ